MFQREYIKILLGIFYISKTHMNMDKELIVKKKVSFTVSM